MNELLRNQSISFARSCIFIASDCSDFSYLSKHDQKRNAHIHLNSIIDKLYLGGREYEDEQDVIYFLNSVGIKI